MEVFWEVYLNNNIVLKIQLKIIIIVYKKQKNDLVFNKSVEKYTIKNILSPIY